MKIAALLLLTGLMAGCANDTSQGWASRTPAPAYYPYPVYGGGGSGDAMINLGGQLLSHRSARNVTCTSMGAFTNCNGW